MAFQKKSLCWYWQGLVLFFCLPLLLLLGFWTWYNCISSPLTLKSQHITFSIGSRTICQFNTNHVFLFLHFKFQISISSNHFWNDIIISHEWCKLKKGIGLHRKKYIWGLEEKVTWVVMVKNWTWKMETSRSIESSKWDRVSRRMGRASVSKYISLYHK